MKKKKFFFFLLPAIFVSSVIILFFLIQSPVFINGLGSVLERTLGYRIRVQNISLIPGLKGEITDLSISRKDGDLSFLCSQAIIESRISKSLKGEIESLTLTQPKLFFQFGKKKKKINLTFLKKLPSVRLLTVKKGEFELSFASFPQVVKMTDINLNIKDFSPRKGGMITFHSYLQIFSSDKRGIEGNGRCEGYVDLNSFFPRPSGRGLVEFHIDSGSYRFSSLKNIVLKFPIKLEKEKIEIDSAILSLDSLTYNRDSKDTTLKDLGFQTSFLYDYKLKALNSRIIEGKISNLGSFKGFFKGNLQGDFPWTASLDVSSINFKEVLPPLKPFIPPEYQEWFFNGRGNMEAHLEGNYLHQRLAWTGDVILSFQGAEFSSPDGTKAGQGITGKVVLKIHSLSKDKKVNFQLSSEIGNGEFLWGKYYKDFSGERIIVSSLGNFFLTSPFRLEFRSSLDIFGTGEYSVSGSIQRDESLYHLRAEKISHNKIISLLLKDYVNQNVPFLIDMNIEGDSYAEIKAKRKDKTLFSEGVLEIKNASLKIPKGPFSIDRLDMMLPFDLIYPFSSDLLQEDEKRLGFLKIENLETDEIKLEVLSIPLVLSQNTLSIPDDIEIPIFRGKLKFTDFKGEDILSPARRFHLSLKLENMDLSVMSKKFKGAGMQGILEANFPSIEYQKDLISTQGQTVAKIFGGKVEATNLHARDLFSRSRKIGVDLSFKDINLEKVTENIKIGRMTGVIQGYIKNLEIEYGQLSHFILDIESVKTKGIKQKISVDAIENISILGTGSEGMTGILSKGIRSFFKEYPYSRIGIRCTLENDKFSVRGKIHEGSTEYLVRRAFLRGVDVVNQNPQNVISFKDMQERIQRIFKAKEGKSVKG